MPPVELDLDTVREWQEVSEMAVKACVSENRFMITARSNNGQSKVTPEEHVYQEKEREMEQKIKADTKIRRKLDHY